MAYAVSVDVGGTTVKLGLFEENGTLLDKWEIVTRREENGSYILSDVAANIEDVLSKKKLSKSEIKGIGIGVAGPITEDGTVLKCANLGWDVFNVSDEVKRLTGISNVKTGNDANVAALGELWAGGGRGYDSILMVTLGTGVGGGLILNGKIRAGSRGAAGEIGHMTVEPEETEVCGCGKRGCLEQFASATGLVRMAKRELSSTEEASRLRGLSHLSAKAVFDAAKEGDPLARRLVDKMCWYLGIACSHVAAVVDPEAFVFGGGVSRAGAVLTDLVRKHYEEHVLYALKGKEFKLAQLGNDAGIYGCAKMVL